MNPIKTNHFFFQIISAATLVPEGEQTADFDSSDSRGATATVAAPEQDEDCLSGAEKEYNELKSTQEQLASAVKTKKNAEQELLKSEKKKVSKAS